MLRHGIGVQCRFHHREILKLKRKAGLFQSLLEDGHVIVGQAERGGHLGASALRVAVYVCAYDAVEGHLNHRRQLRKPLPDLVVGGLDVGRQVFVVGRRVVLHVPAFEKLLSVGLEAFRKHYVAVGDAFLDIKHIAFRSARGTRHAYCAGGNGNRKQFA